VQRIRRKLTYANVVATLALFLVLAGGTAIAARQVLPKNSVGTRQLKKGAVTPQKLSKSSKSALKGAQGPRGEAGPQGQTGPRGLQGEKGAPGATNVVVREATAVVAAESFNTQFVFCKPGEVATGGGVKLDETGGFEVIEDSYPVKENAQGQVELLAAGQTPTGWGATIRSKRLTPDTGRWYVICASP
jgi:hypothetical protein